MFIMKWFISTKTFEQQMYEQINEIEFHLFNWINAFM